MPGHCQCLRLVTEPSLCRCEAGKQFRTIGLNTQRGLERSARLLVATLRHRGIARQALHIRKQFLEISEIDAQRFRLFELRLEQGDGRREGMREGRIGYECEDRIGVARCNRHAVEDFLRLLDLSLLLEQVNLPPKRARVGRRNIQRAVHQTLSSRPVAHGKCGVGGVVQGLSISGTNDNRLFVKLKALIPAPLAPGNRCQCPRCLGVIRRFFPQALEDFSRAVVVALDPVAVKTLCGQGFGGVRRQSDGGFQGGTRRFLLVGAWSPRK